MAAMDPSQETHRPFVIALGCGTMGLAWSLARLGQPLLHPVSAGARAGLAIAAGIVTAVLDQIDLTSLVSQRVDLNALARNLDIDAVIDRADLDRIVDRLPVERVLDRVDVDAIAARIDVDAVVARADLVGIARYIIDAVDLPEIIRSSTGSIVSDTVLGVRMQSIGADERLSRAVDRVLLRRRPRRTGAPGQYDPPEPIGDREIP